MRDERPTGNLKRRVEHERAALRRNMHLPPLLASPWTEEEPLLTSESQSISRYESLGPSPLRHGGVRKTSRSSEANYTGSDYFKNRQVQIESGVEIRIAKLLMADPLTKELRSQTHCLVYKDDDDEVHSHVLDLLQIRTDEKVVGHAVKTEANRPYLQKIVDHLNATGHPEIDWIEVKTDKDAPAWKLHNAMDFLWARANMHETDLDIVRRRALRLGHSVEFWQLFDRGVHHWGREAAIFYLIEQGELVPEFADDRITKVSTLLVNMRC
ncbi:hypothetical protein LZK82_31175 (plasmid) [Rhizobium leguminosarum]|nr:hypothetical protein LZK82_31175 [Rhizobium leguminosarum]